MSKNDDLLQGYILINCMQEGLALEALKDFLKSIIIFQVKNSSFRPHKFLFPNVKVAYMS